MMLIGTSLGQCLRDILAGEVKEEDVVLIITRTMAPTIPTFIQVLQQYYHDSVPGSYDLSLGDTLSFSDVEELALRLWSAGKIHQPRCYDGYVGGFLHEALAFDKWVEIAPCISNSHPSVVEAYEKYKVLDALTK